MASGPALSNGFRSSSPIITFPGQETGVRNAQTTQGIVLTITMLAVAVFCTRFEASLPLTHTYANLNI